MLFWLAFLDRIKVIMQGSLRLFLDLRVAARSKEEDARRTVERIYTFFVADLSHKVATW